MKTKGQVSQKIKQVKYRHLKKFIKKYLASKSNHCLYNRPSSISVGNTTNVSICGHGIEKADWVATPCDFRVDDSIAKSCPKFENLKTKEELKSDFNSQLKSSSIVEIAMEYPDLAALIWVLGDEEEFPTQEDVEEDD